ncbi:DUF6455 family protein [Mesobacterium pallidum]|uniref:DUF6455 family protein n=1 Tax=Mesobacterium pallidum TaxID=2872037 RepID=UPI001EE3211C|nr:DUF6455 family protein [Mesobacterium pallidum]
MQTDRTNKLRRHAALFDDMASTLGIDLQEAALSGALPFGQIADAVLACTDCACVRACDDVLGAAAKGEGQPLAAPGYCRNRSLLDRLQQETGA